MHHYMQVHTNHSELLSCYQELMLDKSSQKSLYALALSQCLFRV